MRITVLVLALFALIVWFGAPRAYHEYHLHQGQTLFYEDTLTAESHFEQASSVNIRNPWSHIYLARIMMTRDDLDEAEAQLALAFGKLPSNSDFDRTVLHNESGKLALLKAEYQEALVSFTQGLELIERLRMEPNPYLDLSEDAAISSLNISRALRRLGRLDEALEMAEHSLREREALVSPPFSSIQAFSFRGDLVRMRAVALSDIGDILVDLGRPNEALERYHESFLQYGIASNSGAPTSQARRDQAGVRWDIAHVYLGLNDIEASLEAFLSTLDLMESVIERNPNYPNIQWHHSQLIFETVELFKDDLDLEGFDHFQSNYLDGTTNRSANDHYAIWAHMFAGDRFASISQPESALQAFELALEKAENRAAEYPEEPALRREIWSAHLRAADLELPQSSEHAGAALTLLETLRDEGHLPLDDEQYIEVARGLLEDV